MRATAIDHVNMGFPADRLDEVIDFYVDRLGFESEFDDPYAAVADDPGLFSLDLGEECSLFVRPSDEFDPAATNFRHTALRIPESPDELRDLFEAEDVEVGHETERERDSIGSYTSFYVEDPFGYTVEFMAVGE